MKLRKPTEQDLGQVVSLLDAAGLPTADLALAQLELIAGDGEVLLGAIGIENFGPIGLLRSLVVSPNARGTGLGRILVNALEKNARESGVHELWLLTIDADPFFEHLGYAVEVRENAPDSIRGTAEFSSLCPGDAVLMRKAL